MMKVVWVIISSVFFFFVGVFTCFTILGFSVKREIRRRLESEKYDSLPVNWLADTRIEKRDTVNFLPATVKAPVLDSAGVVIDGEENKFNTMIVGISRKGISIVSPYFMPKGLDVEVACYERKLSFAFKKAEVRNVTLMPRGIRIGLQFFTPLENV